jgi:hypothetical protein
MLCAFSLFQIFRKCIKIRDPIINKIVLNNNQVLRYVLKTFAAFQHTDRKL